MPLALPVLVDSANPMQHWQSQWHPTLISNYDIAVEIRFVKLGNKSSPQFARNADITSVTAPDWPHGFRAVWTGTGS
jgi:hypothetical protein